MEFSFSEETTMVKESAKRFLRDKCPASQVKAWMKDETGFSMGLWKEMAELGWLGLIHEETYGGMEGSFFDLCVLLQEMGKARLLSPFVYSAVLCGSLIREAGGEQLKEAYLPGLISGEKILTVAFLDGQGREDYRQPKMEARRMADGSFALTGTRFLVPYAHVVDEILVCANLTDAPVGGPTIFKLSAKAAGLDVIPLHTLTEERFFALVCDGVKLAAGDTIGAPGQGGDSLNALRQKAILCTCAEMVGGMERVVAMTVEYTKERRQFGRSLGSLCAGLGPAANW